METLTVLDGITLNGQPVAFANRPDWDPYYCGCTCRRCMLHDDHGGCLTPERHRAHQQRINESYGR